MFLTLFYCFLVIMGMDMLHLNFHDEDRSRYCRCYTEYRPLKKRLQTLLQSWERVLDNPNTFTISLSTACMGEILGWFLRKKYVRIPLDVWFFSTIDGNQYAYGCIRGLNNMATSAGGQKVCPSARRQVCAL